MFFDEDIPFQALRHAAAFWRMASSSSPFCQWTLQMGEILRARLSSRSEEELILLFASSVMCQIHTVLLADGSGHPNAFSQFQGFRRNSGVCCLRGFWWLMLVFSYGVTSA